MDEQNPHLRYVVEWAEGSSSDADDDSSLANILPSYHMYNSTFYRKMAEEASTDAPPHYEVRSPPLTPSRTSEEQAIQWEDTLLANVDKLKKLHNINRDLASKITSTIRFTRSIGKVGETPDLIDSRDVRLQQGKYVYGYVTIRNDSDAAVPFEMFSVVLQGTSNIGIKNGRKTFSKTFLTMFDYNASWNDAFLSRFSYEKATDPYVEPEIGVDPIDSAKTALEATKLLQPGITYKKFFAFKLPEKLLDEDCPHSLVKHLQVPPSMGISSEESFENLRSKYRKNRESSSPEPVFIDDMGFTDCSTVYKICVRAICTVEALKPFGLQYNTTSLNNNEAIIASEVDAFIKVLPTKHRLFEINRRMIDNEGQAMFDNLAARIEEAINTGRTLLTRQVSEQEIEDIRKFNTEIHKIKQSYYQKYQHKVASDLYEVFLPLYKKTVLSSKLVGLLTFTTPKKQYFVEIKSHSSFSEVQSTPQTSISIPISSHMCFSGDSIEMPTFSVDLVALTVKTRNLPIPVVFTSDHLFENSSKKSDNFDSLVIKRFQNYALKLNSLLKTRTVEHLGLEKQTVVELKSIANLASKYSFLRVPGVTITESSEPHHKISATPKPSTARSSEEWKTQMYKVFVLTVDIASAISKLGKKQDFKLTPDFQSCYMARFYFLEITISLGSQTTKLKIPITIQYSCKNVAE